MPDSAIEESLEEEQEDSKTLKVEDELLLEDMDDLPTPEEIDENIDFTENK
jgi:hypothetical protein